MADDSRDKDLEFLDSMSEHEMRMALSWLSGAKPAAFALVCADVRGQRERAAERQAERLREGEADG